MEDEPQYLIRMSIRDMARYLAASNANHFKIKEEYKDQWIENRSRDYIAAAGQIIRQHLVEESKPASIIQLPTSSKRGDTPDDAA